MIELSLSLDALTTGNEVAYWMHSCSCSFKIWSISFTMTCLSKFRVDSVADITEELSQHSLDLDESLKLVKKMTAAGDKPHKASSKADHAEAEDTVDDILAAEAESSEQWEVRAEWASAVQDAETDNLKLPGMVETRGGHGGIVSYYDPDDDTKRSNALHSHGASPTCGFAHIAPIANQMIRIRCVVSMFVFGMLLIRKHMCNSHARLRHAVFVDETIAWLSLRGGQEKP
jgi:hypothetical protein